jgi:4-alpha-glucanotransferase
VSLYLDLPLGVHAESYDTWRERALFVRAVAGGAPPDAFFSWGQNWGFPPPHPEVMREQGYRYFAACVRHLLSRARVLRVDHILGLHRLFWIPRGREAREGVYVRYPAEELYAVLCLESHRYRALVVGEDLGLVPPAIRTAMAAHGISGMYVGPFELSDDPQRGTAPVAPTAVAGLNTHDLPPFMAWWQGLDLVDRQDLGLIDEEAVQRERADRRRREAALVATLQRQGHLGSLPVPPGVTLEEPEDSARRGAARSMLHAWLAQLAASPARIVLVNVEDLWLETAQQNVPGTWRERPNWRRKVRYPFAAWERLPGLRAALQTVDRLRRTVSPATGEQGDAA